MPNANLEALLANTPSTTSASELLALAADLSEKELAKLSPEALAWAGDDVEFVAPADWVERMAGGDYKPVDGLITSLELGDTSLSGAKVVKILKNPHLTHVRALDVGRLKVSNTFWKAARGEASTRGIRRLRCGYIIDRNSSQFDGEHHLDNLETLVIRQSSVVKDSHLAKLLVAPMVANVTHLIVEFVEPELVNWFLFAVSGEDVLPSLDRLTVVTEAGAPLENIFDAPIATRVERVCFNLRALYSDLSEQLRKSTEGGASGPEHVDVSGMTIDPGHRDDFSDEDATNYMNNALRVWKKPSQTRRITLGGWWNEEIAEILESQGLEVVK